MALRCARGVLGATPIRGGRRTVQLTARGRPRVLLRPARRAGQRRALRAARRAAQARSQEANAILLGHGIATELEWEASQPPPGA